MRNFKVILAEALALGKKKQNKILVLILQFLMYTMQLCFQVFGNNIKVCAILRIKILHKIPVQLSFFYPEK